MNQILRAALEYLDLGISIIPIRPRDKKPLIPWQEFQTRLATEEEVYSWFEKHPERNLAIVCGSISGDLVVVDADGEAGNQWMRDHLPITSVYVKTPKSPWTYHGYFRQKSVRNSKPHPQVDIRGEGGYVVAPPSTHPNGGRYELTIMAGSNGWKDLAELKISNLGLDLSGVKTAPTMDPKPEGSRNQSLAQLVGRWCQKGLDLAEIVALAERWNCDNKPPLEAKELFRTVESIVKTHNLHHPGSMVESGGDAQLPDVDLDGPTETDFPDELLNPGGILQKIIDYTERSNAASVPAFALAGAISILGTVCGYRIQGETKLKTNTYVISIGPSGTGKNAVITAIPSLLAMAARNALGPTDLASAAAILRHLQPPEQRVSLIASDEIGMLLKGLRFPESPKAEIPALLTKLFSSCDRPSMKSFADAKLNLTIPYHCLSVYGASTHVEFWKGIHFDDSANGFLARILLFDYQGKIPRPKDTIDIDIPVQLIKELSDIWSIKPPVATDRGNIDPLPIPFIIKIGAEARWTWKPWKEKWFDLRDSARNDQAKASIYNRAVEHAHKLALIHAVSSQGPEIVNGGEIGFESIQWATKLVDRLTADMVRNISESVSENEWHANQKKIVKIIRSRATPETPGMSARDISKLAHMPPRLFDDILSTLEQSGKIHRRTTKPDRGPEKVIFCVSKERGQ